MPGAPPPPPPPPPRPGPPPPPPAPPPCSAPPPPPPCPAAKPVTKISPAHLHKHLAAGPVTPAAALQQALDRFSKLTPGFQNHFVAYNHHTQPRLQEGPQCGLVALAQAREGSSVEEVQQEARARGFTRRGEMFSAANMATLASWLLHPATATLETSSKLLDTSWLLDTLTAGCRLLVPYDCGHNHGPALCGGRKAHWALVTGVVLARAARGEQDSGEQLQVTVLDPASATAPRDGEDFVLPEGGVES